MAFLKHYGIRFSQLNPLAFLRIVHFELSCAAFAGEPSLSLFRRFYRLRSDGDWFTFENGDCFTFENRKDSIFLPCYSFMPTSTYPKAPIVILTTPASSQAKGKGPETSATPIEPVVAASLTQATSQSKFQLPKCFHARIPLAPLCRGLSYSLYSSVEDNPFHDCWHPRDFSGFHGPCSPPSHRFMNFALDPEIFEDQYNLSICEGFFRGAGMLQKGQCLKG
ncbi:hypothetical protein HanHA300_Chr16g0614581 [Helianthus annuus]|nr:hypothetical protein HanHA300_Chr16g0614581 [Helianthus annuus]